jgi:UDP:flavonoid glycosyltransferase YjiC (YdhE family)
MIAIAAALTRAGHDVSMLSQPSVEQRAIAVGCDFIPFSAIPDYARDVALENQLQLVGPVTVGSSVGDDLLDAARERAVDLVVVDANLGGALAAAESLTQPSVVLLHSMYKTFVDTWFGEIWPLVAPGINETRGHYGLASVDGWPAAFAGHDRILSVVPAHFDAPVSHLPETMRYFGFLVPQSSPTATSVAFPPGVGPSVLVGLSTTYQGQAPLLQGILDAIAPLDVRALVSTSGVVDAASLRVPPNAAVTDYVPFAAVLGAADAIVTHAGLGTVAAAASFGVPMVCTPISRDQPLNAERVAEVGAGIALAVDSPSEEIARALERVLTEPDFRDGAAALAAESAAEGGAGAVVADLEALL